MVLGTVGRRRSGALNNQGLSGHPSDSAMTVIGEEEMFISFKVLSAGLISKST